MELASTCILSEINAAVRDRVSSALWEEVMILLISRNVSRAKIWVDWDEIEGFKLVPESKLKSLQAYQPILYSSYAWIHFWFHQSRGLFLKYLLWFQGENQSHILKTFSIFLIRILIQLLREVTTMRMSELLCQRCKERIGGGLKSFFRRVQIQVWGKGNGQVSFLETGTSILAKIQPRKYFLKVLCPHELPSKIVISLKCCFLIENLLNFLIRP